MRRLCWPPKPPALQLPTGRRRARTARSSPKQRQCRGPRDRQWLETVEAFIIDFLRLSLEILRRPKLSNEAALGLESAIDIDPSVATKILVHLVACRISALVRLIRSGLRQARQSIDIQDLLYHDWVTVDLPSHRPCPFREKLGPGTSNKTETSMDTKAARRQSGAMLS